jgi:predicted Zn-dependent protease
MEALRPCTSRLVQLTSTQKIEVPAERAFRKADELAPTTTAAAYNAALCLARQGYFGDAARMMETVLRREPRRPDRADIEAMIRRWRRIAG